MGKSTSVLNSSLRLRDLRSLHSASLAKFWTFALSATLGQWQRRRVCASSERQEAIEEAPMSGAWRQTGLHGVLAVPTPCVHQRQPRPVQTGGGRSVTPSSTQLVSLGRLLLFG